MADTERGLDMPPHAQYPKLFSPLRLGPVELKNRATMAAHGMRLGDDSGVISPRHQAYPCKRRCVFGERVIATSASN